MTMFKENSIEEMLRLLESLLPKAQAGNVFLHSANGFALVMLSSWFKPPISVNNRPLLCQQDCSIHIEKAWNGK